MLSFLEFVSESVEPDVMYVFTDSHMPPPFYVVSAFSKSNRAGITRTEPGYFTVEGRVIPPTGFTLKNLVGFLLVVQGRNYPSMVYVHPKFQRKGIASTMFDKMEEHGHVKLVKSSIQLDTGKQFVRKD